MNKDAIVNRIAHQIGCSRKEVLNTLKAFGMLSEVNKQPIKKNK